MTEGSTPPPPARLRAAPHASAASGGNGLAARPRNAAGEAPRRSGATPRGEAAASDLDFLRRISAALKAGRPFAPEDAVRMLCGIEVAIDGGKLEAALGLRDKWRDRWRQARKEEALRAILGEVSADDAKSDTGLAVHVKLSRYARGEYRRDHDLGRRPADDSSGRLFDFLEANGGKVPAADTLRKKVRKA